MNDTVKEPEEEPEAKKNEKIETDKEDKNNQVDWKRE